MIHKRSIQEVNMANPCYTKGSLHTNIEFHNIQSLSSHKLQKKNLVRLPCLVLISHDIGLARLRLTHLTHFQRTHDMYINMGMVCTYRPPTVELALIGLFLFCYCNMKHET